MARGQLWHGSSFLARPAAVGVPCRGIPQHPPKRCPVSETPAPTGHTNTTCIITRAGSDYHTSWLVFPASSTTFALRTCPTGEKPQDAAWRGREDGGGFTQAASSWTKRIIEVPLAALPLPRVNSSAWAQQHGVDDTLEPGQQQSPRDPRRCQPLAPPAAGSFPSEQMGQGSGGSEGESRKGYFLTLHILQVEHFVRFSLACKSISGSAPGLDVGACESTAAGGSVACQHREGMGNGVSPMQRVRLGGSP